MVAPPDLPALGSLIRYDRVYSTDINPPLWARLARRGSYGPDAVIVAPGGFAHRLKAGQTISMEGPVYCGHYANGGVARTIYPLGEEPDEYLVAAALQALMGEGL